MYEVSDSIVGCSLCLRVFNAIGPEIAEFSTEDEPENLILCQYIDGSTLKSKTFVLASRQEYGLDARLNIEKSGLLRKFVNGWKRKIN